MPRAADVPKIRNSLGLSQPAFARFMGVSVDTLQNWEQERREPQGPARALLLVASRQPGAVMAAFQNASRAFRVASQTPLRRSYATRRAHTPEPARMARDKRAKLPVRAPKRGS